MFYEGKEYLEFIVQTLKPFIDSKYRTKKVESTSIAGSSLGGLISYYALIKYPTVFGSAGIFRHRFGYQTNVLQMLKLL
jgi:alpha-glucosidase